jgi:hypothetical protein
MFFDGTTFEVSAFAIKIPEPSTCLLLVAGIALVPRRAIRHRRRRDHP